MVYKPLAARVALIAGVRRPLPVFIEMIAVVVAVVMWESPQRFPRSVGRVESLPLAFHAFHTPAFPRLAFGENAFALVLHLPRRSPHEGEAKSMKGFTT